MSKFAELITFREIVGQQPKLADLHAILGKYQRRDVLVLLAKLNCLLETWQNTPNFDLDARFSNYLLTKYADDLQRLRRRSQADKLVFSRLGILYLVKQACLACPEQGAQVTGRSAHSDIGICFLIANDLLLPFVPSPSDGPLERIANLLPFADYISHDHYPMEIGRTQIIFNEISRLPALRGRSDFLDICSLFEERFGISHNVFCELIFACAGKFLNLKIEELETNPELATLRNAYFDKSVVPGEVVTRFFSKIACPESELLESVKASQDRPGDDLTIFQAFPLIEIAKDIHICLDPGFLVDKAGRSLYWSLFFEIKDQRGQLAPFWGALFEAYVNHIFKESYAAGGTFVEEPQFSNGDPAFDSCLVEDRNLVVIEYKSSVIRADAKYGGDATKLKKELDLKFIEGDEKGAKGVSQLSKNIARFLRGDNLGEIKAEDISRVYPVLVCLESSMIAPLLGRYLSETFDKIFPRREFQHVVTPVFTLGISDIENLLGYLHSIKLTDVFESYLSRNQMMLNSLSSSEVPILKNAVEEKNLVRERFSEFSERMIRTLFGDAPPDSDKSVDS